MANLAIASKVAHLLQDVKDMNTSQVYEQKTRLDDAETKTKTK